MKHLFMVTGTVIITIIAAFALQIGMPERAGGLKIIILAVGLLLLGVLAYLLYKESKIRKFLVLQSKEQKTAKMPAELSSIVLQRRIELSTLQSQINPHFLYNTLDSIRGEALICGQKDIAEMTERLSKFFRYCISSKGVLVKISEEINNINDYFAIQKYRFGQRVSMEILLEEDSILEYYIPKMTIQPLIENAISHGIEAVRRHGHITVRIGATAKKLCITVSDNGIGLSLGALKKINEQLKNSQVNLSSQDKGHSGIAIANVNSRIRLAFGDEYGLHFRSVEQVGTDAEAVFPIVNDFNRESYETKIKEVV